MNRKQPYVSDYLLGVGARLKKELGSAISGFYLHGSLVNDGGAGFSERRSDVDLLFSTPASHAQERTALALILRPIAKEIENGLRALLPNREFLPVASFCFATDFELAEGIHKNRNTRRAFSTEAFRSLLSTEEFPISIGETLKDDLVGLHFPAWTVLAEAQRFRTKYISVRSDLNATIPDIFDDPALPLPKELLRSTYLYSCLDDRRDPAIETEDDIAKGYDVIKDILDSTGKIDSMALDLFRIIRTNRPGGKGDRRPLSSDQINTLYVGSSLYSNAIDADRTAARLSEGSSTIRG